MKKFTFIALLMLIVCSMAKADDKYFFKVPTDKMDAGWVVQDQSNFASTPGKEYLEVQNKKNGGRMLNYFWNEAAWNGVNPATLPNSTYKFTMDLNMSNMANRADMEFDLLPVNACSATDKRVSSHNYHWFNQEGEDYFFRWRVGEKPAANNGDFTILINENPKANNDWPKTEDVEETFVMSSQKTYKFAVVINTEAKTATYTIADEEGTVLKTGVHNYVCEENRAGIFVFSMNGLSTHQLSNIGLSYEANGPFANEPTSELFFLVGAERDYYVNFQEGETLHWKQLGDATDVITGDTYSNGEEYEKSYETADEKTTFESGNGEYLGHKIIYCTQSGNLEMWTTLDDGTESQHVIVPVTCEEVQMPAPVATITNVKEGFAKEYTLTADNSNTLLKPTVTIHYKKTENGKSEEGDVLTGGKVTLDGKGSLEIYSWDGTNPDEYYTRSASQTINNDVEYVEAGTTNYEWSKDVCDNGKDGFTTVNVTMDYKTNADGTKTAQSHWERVYSNEKYGFDAEGNRENWVADKDYALVREGFGFFETSAVADFSANWNALQPEDATTAFAPLVPTADFIANSKYDASLWRIMPLEGIVYYSTAVNNAGLTLDPKYTSDDPNKPNFYIVHTRGGYDRPDKGDANAYAVYEAGKSFDLYRYEAAICDVRIMTYKGFEPGVSGIKNVNTAETSASAVKKVVTKNGVVIVKDGKTFSVAGAQLK